MGADERIVLKSPKEIEGMRQAGRIASEARLLAKRSLKAGMTTKQLDRIIHDYIVGCGAYPTFLNYSGFPASACISVNDEVIHGIPGKQVIHNGDIVSVDVGATYKGLVGDCAGTFTVGKVEDEDLRLIEVTKQCFFEALKAAVPGNRISDIGRAVQSYAEANGFSVVRDYVGHGVGHKLHEAPEVPNFVEENKLPGKKRLNPRLLPGMVIAVEPMINAGEYDIYVLDNGWTVKTKDGKKSAHYENTILITENEPEILTMCEEI